jgi:hypothetical protein
MDFPKSKSSLKDYAKKNISNMEAEGKDTIFHIINRLPDRKYNKMADLEKSVSSVIE